VIFISRTSQEWRGRKSILLNCGRIPLNLYIPLKSKLKVACFIITIPATPRNSPSNRDCCTNSLCPSLSLRSQTNKFSPRKSTLTVVSINKSRRLSPRVKRISWALAATSLLFSSVPTSPTFTFDMSGCVFLGSCIAETSGTKSPTRRNAQIHG
jgi:hypothetical protein